jgi:hypothetical protein
VWTLEMASMFRALRNDQNPIPNLFYGLVTICSVRKAHRLSKIAKASSNREQSI